MTSPPPRNITLKRWMQTPPGSVRIQKFMVMVDVLRFQVFRDLAIPTQTQWVSAAFRDQHGQIPIAASENRRLRTIKDEGSELFLFRRLGGGRIPRPLCRTPRSDSLRKDGYRTAGCRGRTSTRYR